MTYTNSNFSNIFENQPKKVWLVTGVAGFIGSNLLEVLLSHDQLVVGIDNFETGFQHNLDAVKNAVAAEQWLNFRMIKGDINDLSTCNSACNKVDIVLHQAALGSVPRSIENPIATNNTNVSGFLNMLCAAKDNGIKRFVYAASSSTYGDHPTLPKVEGIIGKPLSPYAVTKLVNEIYADVFAKTYGLNSIGLRYFNVFGKRQNPNGAYSAVIPKWAAALIKDTPIHINGDGETSRDFCHIDNVVQANLLAGLTTNSDAINQVYNIAVGDRTTLNTLYEVLRSELIEHYPHIAGHAAVFRPFRNGDVKHSLADVSKAKNLLGYTPTMHVAAGLKSTIAWYRKNLAK